MKYNITLNQPKMIEHSLNVSQWCILDILSVAPTWCEIVNFNNSSYFWVARQKISEELEAFDFKSDTIFRYLKQLKELGIEIVGDTKVKIAIEEDEEPWDDIPEEVTEETEKEIEENIDPNYIKEEK